MAASDSIRWQVALGVQSLLTNQKYAGLFDVSGPTVPTGVYPLPAYLRGDDVPDKLEDTAPSLILVPRKERDFELTFGNKMLVWYPLLVIFLQNRGHRPEQAQLEANVREIIWMTLFAPGILNGLAGGGPEPKSRQFNIRYDPEPPFNARAWQDEFRVSAQQFSFQVNQQRTYQQAG
jgi:hypothetical protein